MRRVSLNARLALDQVATDELEVVLVIIEHPLLDAPVRLSSDNADRISVEPLMYGTRSTWRTDDGSPFLFIMLDALVPDEEDDAPAQASLVLEILDSDIADILTATTVQATCHMAIVLASSPDNVEAEWIGLLMTGADGDSGQVSIKFSMEPITGEPYPADRMTKERFPGLHK
ncbi:DUF1833 domain-containing protein [Mesorhizobium sp. M0437]|uniref:DUF1833 family protein n=1 Tax=Mesorhizobium sp. M0437 TaxID=2956945 RepID=UPI003339200E